MRLICVRIDSHDSKRYYSLSAFNRRFSAGFESIDAFEVWADNSHDPRFFELSVFDTEPSPFDEPERRPAAIKPTEDTELLF